MRRSGAWAAATVLVLAACGGSSGDEGDAEPGPLTAAPSADASDVATSDVATSDVATSDVATSDVATTEPVADGATGGGATRTTDLCPLLSEDVLAATLGAGWSITNAEPLGGDNTCYWTLQGDGEQESPGIKIDAADDLGGVLAMVNDPVQVDGIGEQASVGLLGGQLTMVVKLADATVSFGGVSTQERLEAIARALVARL